MVVYNLPIMFIERVPNRNLPPTILIRSSHREGKKTFKATHANLTGLPESIISVIELALKGKQIVCAEEAFKITRSLPHGHVEAICASFKKLDLERIVSSTQSRERNIVLAMIASRIISPCSKLAMTKQLKATTLGEEFGLKDVPEDEVYAAMDWLYSRKERIEKKLVDRHLKSEEDKALVLYDISSSSYYGETCPLAKWGYNRDKKKMPSIVYGILTDKRGCPLAVEIYEGNTSDSKTVMDQIEKLTRKYGVKRLVFVGDRGMVTGTQIKEFKKREGLGWITALRSCQIRTLLDNGEIQPSLFDERHLAEISSPEYPGERLVVCRNPIMLQRRRNERASLLQKTEEALKDLQKSLARLTKTPLSESEIGDKSGRILDKHKMRKHFTVTISAGKLDYVRNAESIEQEEQLDGIYIIRTSEPVEEFSDKEVVGTYKSLSQVEDAFRCIKGMDLSIRPIRHRLDERVKTHVFLCLLSYYVEWHMRKALSSVLYQDEEKETLERDDPVSPAKVSDLSQKKKSRGKTEANWTVYDWKSLILELGTCCRNKCVVETGDSRGEFVQTTLRTPFQEHVFNLLGLMVQ
jgi:Transposase